MRCLFLTLLAVSVLILSLAGSTPAAQSHHPGQRENVSLGELTFSCPREFTVGVAGSVAGKFTLLRHDKYDLVIGVAVSDMATDSDRLSLMAATLAKALHPQEATSFSWKRLDYYKPVSKHEIAGGMLQGFNGTDRVGVQARVLRVGASSVVVAYGWNMGSGSEARDLFKRNLGGDSMPGWYAQARVISSLTGEPYDTVNPPGGGIAAPPPGGAG